MADNIWSAAHLTVSRDEVVLPRMDKLHAMTTFVQIAERGSLTQAAEALGTSLPSVVRTLAALEKLLGARLFNRTTRRIALTEEGRLYLEQCRRILTDIEEAESALTANQKEPSGNLNVTAPALFGQMHVTPVIAEFVGRFKLMHVELLLLDRIVNLVEEGIDVGIRIGHLGDSSLIAVPVGHIRRVVCASPKYLKRAGVAARPGDLAAVECVRVTGLTPGATWNFYDKGQKRSVQVKGPFVSNQAAAAIEACARGLGYGMFLSYQVQPLLEQRRLQLVLERYEPAPIPVHIVYPHAKLLSARVRSFVDYATGMLRQILKA